MKRHLVAVLALACTLTAASCGKKAADESATSGTTPPAGGETTTPPSSDTSATAASSSAVLAVSKYDAGPRAGESAVNATAAKQGEGLFKSKGCVVCHGYGRKITCPDLKGVSMQRTALWMENQILHPDVMVREDPIAHDLFVQYKLQMTKQGLTAEEARAVIEHLKQLDHEAGLTPTKGR